ncbi:phosphate ABC transporter permease subunit PstC [Flavihumibacter sp. R14]|nr:phosphate ABC transporter permease subunit PstC [Flavihumibacter soli]
MFWKKLPERLMELLMGTSALVTSVTILLIIFFLFREGFGIFSSPSVEKGYVIAVNKANPVGTLHSEEIKKIFDHEITDWSELGGPKKPITLFRISDITKYYKEQELGANLELLPQKLNELLARNPGIIAFLPDSYLPDNFNGKILKLENISVLDFLGGKEWFPTAQPSAQFGAWPLILGTLYVSLVAILLALPLGLATAIYLAEIADRRTRDILKPVIELLAGIPSVVYGFFGLVVIVPLLKDTFDLDSGQSGLAGGILLAIMALPTIITVSEDALRNTPNSMREASLAMGASKWQTIYKIVVPYSSSGISAAAILGIGRAMGETMAVLMVTGNAAVIPYSILEPLRTIPATIAAELGEAPTGGLHYQALFTLGCILFIITVATNLTASYISRKQLKAS